MISPLKLLRLDCLGAACSAFLLGVVLPQVQPLLGIPYAVLYTLALVPVGLVLFDGYFLFWRKRDYAWALWTVAGLNLGYCALSLALAAAHAEHLEVLGWAYLLVEVTIVAGLALVERRVARRALAAANE